MFPSHDRGVRTVIQIAELMDSTDAATFDCAGTDVLRTGSIIETRDTNKVAYDTSTAGETRVVMTPTATNSFVDLGTIFIFSCLENGIWDVEMWPNPDPAGTGLTGTVAFAS